LAKKLEGNKKPIHPSAVGGATGNEAMAAIWKKHFKPLLISLNIAMMTTLSTKFKQ